jgi:probable phosphomutase (TIGR03848 family)
MTRFLLIRHGATDAIGKRLTGRAPGLHLNEQGKLQVKELAERLRHLRINAVYCSPLERTIETAEPIAFELKLQPIISEEFLEIDFGQWTNCAYDDVKLQKDFQLFNAFRSSTRIPGGELMSEAQLRIVQGIEKLFPVHQDETIVIVSHADVIRAAVAYYAGIHLDLFQRLHISPASVSIFELYQETARIVLLNHTGNISF